MATYRKQDVDLNRPGMKGFRVKTPKKRGRAAEDESEDGADRPAPKKARGKKAVPQPHNTASDGEAPASRKGRGHKATTKQEYSSEGAEAAPSAKKAKKGRGRKAAPLQEEDVSSDVEAPPPVKTGRSKRVAAAKEEPADGNNVRTDEATIKHDENRGADDKPVRGRPRKVAMKASYADEVTDEESDVDAEAPKTKRARNQSSVTANKKAILKKRYVSVSAVVVENADRDQG